MLILSAAVPVLLILALVIPLNIHARRERRRLREKFSPEDFQQLEIEAEAWSQTYSM